MPMYQVSVEKALYCTGSVEIEANSPEEAIDEVQLKILNGTLQSSTVNWSDPTYEDCSFQTTGDVE